MTTIQPEWETLAEAAGNPFLTFEWAAACAAQQPEGALHISIVRDAGRPVAVLPMVEVHGRLRFLGQGTADVVGPVCAPADLPAAADGLRTVLARGPVHLLDAWWLPAEQSWPARLGGTAIRRESCPVLRIGGRSWETILAGRSANFRAQVGRRRRTLERAHDVAIRRTERAAELPADLDTLLRLHEQRFGARSVAFRDGREAVHRTWAAAALERGWLALWTLELDGLPAASLYVFRFGGLDWFYQSGRDARFERERVGFVLLCHAIEDACRAGQDAFSFLLGDEPYKRRFADEDAGLEHVMVAEGARASAALTAARGATAARHAVGATRRALRRRN